MQINCKNYSSVKSECQTVRGVWSKHRNSMMDSYQLSAPLQPGLISVVLAVLLYNVHSAGCCTCWSTYSVRYLLSSTPVDIIHIFSNIPFYFLFRLSYCNCWYFYSARVGRWPSCQHIVPPASLSQTQSESVKITEEHLWAATEPNFLIVSQ